MKMKKNIAIVAGGDSSEMAVSLKSADGLYSFIDKDRYNLYIAIVKKGDWEVKLSGGENDLLCRIQNDSIFGLTKEEISELSDPKTFTGCAEKQTEDFITGCVYPVLEKNKDMLGVNIKINV